jgi:tetratricopeptide (TPR) repeat protein
MAPIWGIAAGTLLVALGLAGAHPTALSVTGGVFALSALLAWRAAGAVAIPAPGVVAFVLAACCLIQSLPLPVLLLRVLDPAAADVWSRALHPLKESVSWGALSLDPGASVRESFKWSLYGLAFVSAGVIRERFGRHVCALFVFVPSVAVALVTLAHGVVGATHVFGVYQPTFRGSAWQLGPFLNPNNLSGYLNLGAFTGLGLVISERLARYRVVIGAGVAVSFAVSILSGSRGGVWMLPAGLGAFLLLVYVSARRRSPRSRGELVRGKWVLLAVVASGVAFAGLGATKTTWTQLLNDNLEKLQIIAWAWPLVRDFPVFGVGRGAFESVFPAYLIPGRNAVYSHPENFVVQWVAEWGIPVGILGLLAFAWSLRPRPGAAYGSALGSGLAVGAGLLFLQNLVDLGLEMPAIALSTSFALGTLWHAAPKRERLGRWSIVEPLRASRVRRALTVAVAGGWLLLWTDLGRQVSLERQALHEAAAALNIKDQTAVSTLRTRLRSAMLRHPAEPYFPRLGASVALAARDQDPLPWVQRALERGEFDARSHQLAAEALRRRGAVPQALFELRRAVELDASLAQSAGRTAVLWSPDIDAVMRAAPRTPAGSAVLTAAAFAWNKPNSTTDRERLLRAAVSRDPSLAAARIGLGRVLLERAEKGNCAECAAQAIEQAEAVLETTPSRGAIELRSDALVQSGRWKEAELGFSTLCPRLEGTDVARCWFAQLTLVRKKPGATVSEVSSVLNRATDAACAALGQCAEWLREAGDVARQQRDLPTALGYYERAADQSPSVDLMLRIADAARGLELLARADAALARASHLAASDPDQLKQIEAQRESLRREVLQRHRVH